MIRIGSSVRGTTVISAGGGGSTVVVDGKVVSEGEPLPEVSEEFDGIACVEIDGWDVYIEPGEKFKAAGTGYVKRFGDWVVVSDFEGNLVVPDVGKLSLKVDSGTVRGSISSAQSIDAKANSGVISIVSADRGKPVTINAKANSGDIQITIR